MSQKAPTEICSPLADAALKAFEQREHHDKHTLACHFASAAFLRTRTGKRSGMNAYTTVAEDVLGRLEEAGLLVRTETGWFTLPTTQ